VIAGVATSDFGLHETALIYSAAIAALVAAAAGTVLLGRGATFGRSKPGAGRADLPPGPCTVPPSILRIDRPGGPKLTFADPHRDLGPNT
jgi:hypothetical protein